MKKMKLLEEQKMNAITLIEKISHAFTELLYLIAIILYKAWQYRQLILFFMIMTTLFLTSLFMYCNLTA